MAPTRRATRRSDRGRRSQREATRGLRQRPRGGHAGVARGVAALALALTAGACAPRFLQTESGYVRDEVVVEPPAARAPGVEAPANPCARREVRSQWIYTPDQSYVALARAWPRRAEQLETTIAYCIDTGGKVDGIELERSSGVDAIDQAALDVIAKWRAKPHMIDGAPARACSALTFTVRAIRPRRHDED